MNITNNGWFLTLNLNGGRIQELHHKGIKIFGTYNRSDGKVGNTHLCVPSFDKEGIEFFGLPFHGLVRNNVWKVDSRSASSLVLSCSTAMTDTYPAKLFVEQEFVIEDHFIHIIRVTHLEGKEVPLNIGLHYYWDTPQGWNMSSLNNEQIASLIKTNGYRELRVQNDIVFPHARYELSSRGFRTAVLWTSFNSSAQGMKEFNNNFCCIEPVIQWPGYFGTKQSILRAGETKSVTVSLVPQEGLEPPSL